MHTYRSLVVVLLVFIGLFWWHQEIWSGIFLVEYQTSFNYGQYTMQNGSYIPFCPKRKLVFIIPFRDESESHFRLKHLYLMLHYTIPYLIKQGAQFTMVVINQASGKPFNKAKLLNIGFTYVNELSNIDADCFVLHDVDLIPESVDFVYYCDEETPLHLSAWRQNQNYKPSYATIMGGVATFTREQFYAVNGYSNEYWGWGAEDDDISNRVRSYYNLTKVPRPSNKTNYHIYQIEHERDENNQKNPNRVGVLKKWKERWSFDGINNISEWSIIETTTTKYYVNLTVQV